MDHSRRSHFLNQGRKDMGNHSQETKAHAKAVARWRRGVNFEDAPMSPKGVWTEEMERRLIHAQQQLERHQKRWSAKQEEFIEEVERLLEAKRRYEKFARRRSKDHQREGLRAWQLQQNGRETSAEEDSERSESTARFGGLLRRMSSVKTSQSGEEDLEPNTNLVQYDPSPVDPSPVADDRGVDGTTQGIKRLLSNKSRRRKLEKSNTHEIEKIASP